MLSPETAALIAVTFLTAGFIKGAVGMGLPVVVLAMLTATLGLKDALALFLIPGIFSNFWQMLSGDALARLFRRMWSFLLAAVVGIWFGTGILAASETRLLEALLGGLLIGYAAF